jgi:hypothetical protein
VRAEKKGVLEVLSAPGTTEFDDCWGFEDGNEIEIYGRVDFMPLSTIKPLDGTDSTDSTSLGWLINNFIFRSALCQSTREMED